MEYDAPRPTRNIPVRVPETVDLIDERREFPRGDPTPGVGRRPPRHTRRKRLAIGLFVATCVSTFLVGAKPGSADPFAILVAAAYEPRDVPQLLWNGLLYSAAVMAILLSHEMGHYLQTRRNGIAATYPYFIPFPISPFGTMGAVILQDGTRANRRMLFDIAISGPLAGLVLALPITYFGVVQAKPEHFDPSIPTLVFGEPLILQWIVRWIHGPLASDQGLMLNPLLFAGWVGIFITALNLIPIGQLDGGHILYTLIGRRAHAVAILLMAAAAGLMIYFQYHAYALMLALLFLMGPRHPPTADDSAPLGPVRVILGGLTLAFIVVGFTPVPVSL